MTPEPEAVLVVLCTAPAESAARLADLLLEARLVACVNILPGIESRYVWQGQVEISPETLLVMKTTAARLPELERRLNEAHPYEVPEILALPAAGGLPAYLQWVVRSCSPPGEADA